MVKKIEIEVTGDTRGLERALSKSQKQASSWQKGLSAAAKGGAVALAGLGVAAAYSVKSASNLSEQINKASVVFRGSEKAIIKWSESTAGAFGISQRAALEAAGTFGNMLVPMGLARGEAGRMSTKMVELAADMASFNNASPEEVLEALRSGLSGEAEPLRRFGVFLNQARVEAEAMNLGLVKNVKNMGEVRDATTKVDLATKSYTEAVNAHGKESEEAQRALLTLHSAERALAKATKGSKGEVDAAAKAQATYSLILKDTGDAAGDFGRTSDSLANQQRILRAELEDVAAQLGNALIPAATGAASVLLDLVNVVKENEDAAKTVAVAIGVLSAGLILANASLKIYTSATLAAIGATKGLRLAMAATPWGLAAVAASGLVAWLISQGDEADEASVAQDRLTDAVRDYQRAIKAGNDARKEYAETSRRQEGAEIAVKRAIQARTQVDKDATSTALDRQEADLRVSDALAALRDAEDATSASGTRLRNEQLKQVGAQGRAKASVEALAQEYRDWAKGIGPGSRVDTALERSRAGINQQAFAMHTGRANAERYADRLRAMAATMEDSQPKLAETARLAARLADAWGRVVSLPAAREFVARFSVFTTVETTRTIPKQAGGPVRAGQAYLVGEKRPEVFVPNESGRIVPRVNQLNGGSSGGGGRWEIALIAAGPDVIRQLRELERRGRRGGAPAF